MAKTRPAPTEDRELEDLQEPEQETAPEPTQEAAPEQEAAPADTPDTEDVPVVTGKGGRYRMENGKRVLRTD